MSYKSYIPAFFLFLFFLVSACSVDRIDTSLAIKPFIEGGEVEKFLTPTYKTKNVVILVIDGPRYSETWGSTTRSLIPVLNRKLAPLGVVSTTFFNLGETFTNPGHTAITTGNYQKMRNNGTELPDFPSIFQHWSHKYSKEKDAAYIIASKDKLEILADTNEAAWKGEYRPATDCGKDGLGNGYRSDAITYRNTFEILSEKHPGLVLINLKSPDSFGHANDWENYLSAISNSDRFLGELWDFLQNDPFYSQKTTLFMTNDHGRHGDGNQNGFVSHGDGCPECRHLNFLAIGPDFKKNEVLAIERSQIDIPATVAELLHFEMPFGKGEVMHELFNIPTPVTTPFIEDTFNE